MTVTTPNINQTTAPFPTGIIYFFCKTAVSILTNNREIDRPWHIVNYGTLHFNLVCSCVTRPAVNDLQFSTVFNKHVSFVGGLDCSHAVFIFRSKHRPFTAFLHRIHGSFVSTRRGGREVPQKCLVLTHAYANMVRGLGFKHHVL